MLYGFSWTHESCFQLHIILPPIFPTHQVTSSLQLLLWRVEKAVHTPQLAQPLNLCQCNIFTSFMFACQSPLTIRGQSWHHTEASDTVQIIVWLSVIASEIRASIKLQQEMECCLVWSHIPVHKLSTSPKLALLFHK